MTLESLDPDDTPSREPTGRPNDHPKDRPSFSRRIEGLHVFTLCIHYQCLEDERLRAMVFTSNQAFPRCCKELVGVGNDILS